MCRFSKKNNGRLEVEFCVSPLSQRNEFADFQYFFFKNKNVRHIENESKTNEQRNDMFLK